MTRTNYTRLISALLVALAFAGYMISGHIPLAGGMAMLIGATALLLSHIPRAGVYIPALTIAFIVGCGLVAATAL